MTKLIDTNLIALSLNGLIPGPNEDEEQFLKRVELAETLKDQISPEHKEVLAGNGILEEAYPITKKLYGIAPTWIPVFFSNAGLAPWHAAAAWIVQEEENSPACSMLQMRAAFSKQPTYPHYYDRSEVVAHELCHAGRMTFEEPKYEEILAYRSSSTFWGRYFGQIVQSSTESMFFLLSLILIIAIDLVALYYGSTAVYLNLMWLKFLPILFIVYAFTRLYFRQASFKKCLQVFTEKYGEEKANAIIYRLTDKEIDQITLPDDSTLRGRLISLLSKPDKPL